MALSLREKLQKASLATIATNAARTLAKLDVMERPTPPRENPPVAAPPLAVTDKTTQKTTHKATQQATHQASDPPSKRPKTPVMY